MTEAERIGLISVLDNLKKELMDLEGVALSRSTFSLQRDNDIRERGDSGRYGFLTHDLTGEYSVRLFVRLGTLREMTLEG